MGKIISKKPNMLGLYKVKNDDNFTAVSIEKDSVILFPGSNGMSNRNEGKFGKLSDLSENALFVKNGDETLIEACDALRSGRPARWTQSNF